MGPLLIGRLRISGATELGQGNLNELSTLSVQPVAELRNPAAFTPASAQAASSAGASPETPTAPIRRLPSAAKTGIPPATSTTCGAWAKPGVPRAPSIISAVGKPQAAAASALA